MFKLVENMNKIYGRRYNKLFLQFKNWMELLVKIRLLLLNSKNLLNIWVFLLLMINFSRQFFIIFGNSIIQLILPKNMQVLVRYLIQPKKDIYMIIIDISFMEVLFPKVLLLELQFNQLHMSPNIENFDINLLRLLYKSISNIQSILSKIRNLKSRIIFFIPS